MLSMDARRMAAVLGRRRETAQIYENLRLRHSSAPTTIEDLAKAAISRNRMRMHTAE
jgi:hypothetical protein